MFFYFYSKVYWLLYALVIQFAYSDEYLEENSQEINENDLYIRPQIQYEYVRENRRPIDGRKLKMDEPRSHSKFKTKRENIHSNSELWFYGLGSTFLVSMAPFVILWFIPVDNTAEYEPMLKVFLSFASGGLLGDALLHLIPHAIIASENETHTHEEGHSHSHGLRVGVWVFIGIVTFFVVEKLVRLVKGGAHSHHHRDMAEESKIIKPEESSLGITKRIVKKKDEIQAAGDSPRKRSSAVIRKPEIKASAYLNLAADFIHNFTDGLAIGASYLAGKEVGFVTTVTVFFHEVPHELGDFAILIQSGYSKKQAMFLQLFTGLGSMFGAVCGLLAEGFGDSAITWILPFTAGGFIYLACVSVIAELLHDTSIRQSIAEVLGFITGFGFMLGVSWYE